MSETNVASKAPETPNRPPAATGAQAQEAGAQGAESGGTDNVAGKPVEHSRAETGTPGVLKRGEPGYGPKPGDPDYAPPARTAQPAGVVLKKEHYDYHGGTSAVNVHGQSPLAMPAPAYATVSSDTALTRPSQLSTNSAITQGRKMFADLSAWVADFSHEATGEFAVWLQFVRDLNARKAALGTAAQLGRTMDPDEVDKAKFTPPPEFFQLRHMAAQLCTLQKIYDNAMGDAQATLSGQDQATVDRIIAEFEPLSDGPQSPEEAEIDPADEPKVDAQSPELHSPVPQQPAARVRQTGATGSRSRIADSQPQMRVQEGQKKPVEDNKQPEGDKPKDDKPIGEKNAETEQQPA